MIFTTKNKELVIFGNTLTEINRLLINFFEAYERGGIKGQDGIIDTFFTKDRKSPLPPELLVNFEEFKSVFNSSSLSAEALAEQMENVDQRIIDYAKTCKNGELTTKGFTSAIEGMSFSAKAGKFALEALKTAGNMAVMFAVSKALEFVVTSVSNYIHRVENANEATKEAVSTFESITSEIETLESKLDELDTQSEKLNSITDAEELKNIQAETEELNLQLAILKEKQRIAEDDADNAAQNSLTMKQTSKYKVIEYESAYGGYESYTASVTKDEELLNAIEAYDDYKAKVDDANKTLAEMAQTGNYSQKQWKKQEKIVEKYSQKMDDARSHANELALTLSEQKQGLNGNTEASQELIDTVDHTLNTYNGWLDAINGTTDALIEQADAQKTTEKHTFSLTETQSQSIDKFQSKVKTLSDTLAALNSGTFSQADMADLLQEFPQLTGETDNLQSAIQELINTLLYDLYAALGADIPQELKDSLRAIADEAGRTSSEIKTVADAISDVSSLHSVMQSFSEELSSGTISADTLENIAAKYPQLEDAVNAYCMGLITEQELYGQLSEQYDNACLAFQAANRAKIYENGLFYQNALETHNELVENLKTTYGIDFRNFTSLEVAKKEAELKLIGELSNMWYKYYDIVMGADGLYRVQSTGFGESYDEQNSQIYQDMSNKADEMQTFLDDLNNAFGLKDLFENNNSLKGSLLDPSATPSTQTKETFNWIERAIKRVQEALARLTKIRDNTFKTWGERNGALQSEIAATTHELQLQAQAHYKYLELAAAVPLDDYHKALVQSGAINLETVTDSNLKELISEYEDFYQKAVDAYDAVEDLQKTLSQLAKTRFDSVLSQFNNELSLIESRKEQLDNSISDMETRGYAVSAKLYEELALSESENLSKIRTERDALLKSLNDAVTDGSIQAYSEEWYNMAGTINDVTAAMQKSQTQLIQYQNTLKELNWENFDNLQKTIGRIVNESDFMIDLLENETLTSGTGTFTDEGLATVGLHAVNYNTFMAQADRYAEKLRELQKELANDPYNQTLIDKERELADAQRDSILSAEQEKQAMISLSRNAIQEQIDALEKLIDKKKESFNTEKDLYEFQKTIAEKTKAVTDIKKQLSVAKLDTSEEGKQRLLDLQNRLKNAEDDLKETQYDRWIKEQETLLDNMMTEYETLQNELSENTDLLLKDLISMTNENASAISDTIRTKTDELGITLTEELETIFNGEGSVKNIVSIYSDNFNSHMTTLQGVINGIEQKNTEMIVAIDNLGSSFITAINTAAGMFNTSQNPSPTLPENGGFNAFNQTPATAPSNPAQGQRVDSASGIWYASSAGSNPSGNVNHFAPDYFIVDRINPNSPYPYHIQAYINGKATGGSGWVKASQIGYKDGLKNAKTAHLAWTQEDGGELIYRKSDHALFTPIGAGDAVFTRQMSDNLWNLAKGTYSVPEPQTRSLGASQKGDVIISIDKMNLPDVTNPQQFASRFVDTLKNDSKVQSAIRSVSVDLLAGRPKSKVNTF